MALISTLLKLTGSRSNCTLPLAFRTKTKLLHHSNISSTIIWCFCSWSSSSLSGSCGAYTILLGGAWYYQLPSITCNLTHAFTTCKFLKTHHWIHSEFFALIPGFLFCLLLWLCITWNVLACLHHFIVWELNFLSVVDLTLFHPLSLVCLAILCQASIATLDLCLAGQWIYIWYFYLNLSVYTPNCSILYCLYVSSSIE